MSGDEAVRLYATWAAGMKRRGADLSALPNDPAPIVVDAFAFGRPKTMPRIAAVFRDPQVWGRLVNAKELPLPTQYGGNGTMAYYLAPLDVQRAFAQVVDADSQEAADRATSALLKQWGVPSALQGIGHFAATIKWAVYAGVALFALWLLVRLRRAA